MYEVKYSYTTVDHKGNDKVVKETIICENAATFGDAEEIAYNHVSGETDVDVFAVKRSPIKEIVNRRTNDNEKIFLATIIDYFYVEGKEEPVENKYILALHAEDINKAHAIVREHLKQGLDDMELVALKCTKIVDIIK